MDNQRKAALTTEQLQILQHSLGVDQHGQGPMYRNHFCAGADDEDVCRELVAMGYMETFTRSYLPYYNCTVTPAGKAAMREQSPKPPKLTRSQQRYRAYLKADTGFSFREYLEMLKCQKRATDPPEILTAIALHLKVQVKQHDCQY